MPYFAFLLHLLLVPFKLWKMVSSKHIGNPVAIYDFHIKANRPVISVMELSERDHATMQELFRAVFDCLLRFIQEFLH